MSKWLPLNSRRRASLPSINSALFFSERMNRIWWVSKNMNTAKQYRFRPLFLLSCVDRDMTLKTSVIKEFNLFEKPLCFHEGSLQTDDGSAYSPCIPANFRNVLFWFCFCVTMETAFWYDPLCLLNHTFCLTTWFYNACSSIYAVSL